MDPKIAERFNEGVLAAAAHHYGIQAKEARLLDGFESYMYEFDRADGSFILRIGHSLRRTPELIQGEVDWINYLARGGVSVAAAIHSEAGNLVEFVDDGQGGQFICTGFIKAPGGPTTRDRLSDRLFCNYGRLLGRMHALAKQYRLPNPAWKRPEWDDPINMCTEDWLPARETEALKQYLPLKEHLFNLPKDPDGYGMIHQDAHPANFFIDEQDRITLFDFDDCAYGHFIYDIAMALFYASFWGKDKTEFTAWFMPVFLRGYREENRLDPAWLVELPNFLKLREIDLFAQILFSFPDGEPYEPWSARYMPGRRERIAAGVPFIDFDWQSLGLYL